MNYFIRQIPSTLLIFVAVVSVTLTKGLITSLQAMAAEPFNTDDIVLQSRSFCDSFDLNFKFSSRAYLGFQ